MNIQANAELLDVQTEHVESIRAKLFAFYGCARPRAFFDCGEPAGSISCDNCGEYQAVVNHCSRKWCPFCQHRIVRERVERLREFAKLIKQPKLVTLTQRNSRTFRRRDINAMNQNLRKLRRQEVFAQVKGGSQSIEITNESKGWHLHAHLFVDARWIDQRQLSIAWGKLVGQDYAVVDVRDRRQQDAGAEAAKYVCKPADFASWPPNEIAEFIHAISHARMFNVFGTLEGLKQKVAAQIAMRRPAKVCDCGCSRFIYRELTFEQKHGL